MDYRLWIIFISDYRRLVYLACVPITTTIAAQANGTGSPENPFRTFWLCFHKAMKVFISWSGPLSKAVAELLKDWIKCVLQATEPFLSSEDIDKGAQWSGALNDQLAATDFG